MRNLKIILNYFNIVFYFYKKYYIIVEKIGLCQKKENISEKTENYISFYNYLVFVN